MNLILHSRGSSVKPWDWQPLETCFIVQLVSQEENAVSGHGQELFNSVVMRLSLCLTSLLPCQCLNHKTIPSLQSKTSEKGC